ncbi:hypothetical protein ACH42_13970 [Endozoicomonas sp. (ex Bugula neritina AB1)]|nr:hypothetical protein ACH42_13970 [Endozoicomonas sp. (ex Bugula neritina AB1)]
MLKALLYLRLEGFSTEKGLTINNIKNKTNTHKKKIFIYQYFLISFLFFRKDTLQDTNFIFTLLYTQR